MRLARLTLLAIAFLAVGCSSEHSPLEPLAGTLEVQVVDAPVVARIDEWGELSFKVRLALHNSSSDLPLRWGGCGWLVLRLSDGEFVWSPPCTPMRPVRDDRPVIAPGETVVIEETLYLGRDWTRWPEVEREFRLTAYFGSRRVESLERMLGHQPGQSDSNVFALTIDD